MQAWSHGAAPPKFTCFPLFPHTAFHRVLTSVIAELLQAFALGLSWGSGPMLAGPGEAWQWPGGAGPGSPGPAEYR